MGHNGTWYCLLSWIKCQMRGFEHFKFLLFLVFLTLPWAIIRPRYPKDGTFWKNRCNRKIFIIEGEKILSFDIFFLAKYLKLSFNCKLCINWDVPLKSSLGCVLSWAYYFPHTNKKNIIWIILNKYNLFYPNSAKTPVYSMTSLDTWLF